MATIRRFFDYTITQTVSVTSCAVDVPDDEELIKKGFTTSATRDAHRRRLAREALSENIQFAYSVAKTGGTTLAITDIKEARDWRETYKEAKFARFK